MTNLQLNGTIALPHDGAARWEPARENSQGTGMKKTLVVSAAALALSGCVYNKQTATLAPTVVVAKTNEGEGALVGLRVVDERPTKSLGHRGNIGGRGAEITTNQDLAVVVQSKISEGLSNRGYKVVPYDGASTKLSVELRSLEYSTSTGFWSGGVAVNAAMKAVAIKPGDTYEKMYRSDAERRVQFVPTAGKNEQDLNNGVSAIIADLFADVGLFKFIRATQGASGTVGD
ncbi:YajG family lipoprotein [Streptomyces niveus]|uniref:YajG family lipoprotein n=4 Tax=Bacillati TaxID=1783272 RepID=UPI0036A3BABD